MNINPSYFVILVVGILIVHLKSMEFVYKTGTDYYGKDKCKKGKVEDGKVGGSGVTGEVAMEQAYLKFVLNPRQYIVAGLFLPRIGIVNENHLPVNTSDKRPINDQAKTKILKKTILFAACKNPYFP